MKQTLSLCVLATLLAGCAAAPKLPAPNQQILDAGSALANADQAGATTHAATELRIATQKLEGARKAVADGHMVLARRYAEQARLEAELAQVRSEAASARAAVDSTRRAIETERQTAPAAKPGKGK